MAAGVTSEIASAKRAEGTANSIIEGVALHHFAIHRDDRGALVALDHEQSLPFVLCRAYYMFDLPADQRRGGHAVNADSMLVAVSGSVSIEVDNGRQSATVLLDVPDRGLWVRSGVFLRLTDFRDRAVVLVLSSKLYSAVKYTSIPPAPVPGRRFEGPADQ